MRPGRVRAAGGRGDDAGRGGRGVDGGGNGYTGDAVSRALRWTRSRCLPPLTARAARTNLKRCIMFVVCWVKKCRRKAVNDVGFE